MVFAVDENGVIPLGTQMMLHERNLHINKLMQENKQLREALRFMLDNDRNLQKPLEELFAEFCNEARKALGETEPEELGEKE
jgi:hypothetical protein